jgi:hypothetical protein
MLLNHKRAAAPSSKKKISSDQTNHYCHLKKFFLPTKNSSSFSLARSLARRRLPTSRSQKLLLCAPHTHARRQNFFTMAIIRPAEAHKLITARCPGLNYENFCMLVIYKTLEPGTQAQQSVACLFLPTFTARRQHSHTHTLTGRQRARCKMLM